MILILYQVSTRYNLILNMFIIMKKSLILAALLVAGVASTFAVEYTAKAKISLGETTITMRESASYSDAFDNGADVSNYNSFGIAVVNEISGMGSNWVQWASAELEGLKIGFKALAAGEQTFSFSGVIGTLYLVDAVAGTQTEIVNDGSYVFTADAADVSAWNTTRFSITKVLPAKPYTFINNTLVINEATDGAEITITPFTYGVDGKDLGDPIITHAPMDEDLTGMGYLLITYTNAEGVEREFIVNTNPDVQPAND